MEVQRLTRRRPWQRDLLEIGRIDQSFHEGRGHLITLRFLVALAEDSCGLDLFEPTRTGPSTRKGKNERYWERRRQTLWEERTRGYRRR